MRLLIVRRRLKQLLHRLVVVLVAAVAVAVEITAETMLAVTEASKQTARRRQIRCD